MRFTAIASMKAAAMPGGSATGRMMRAERAEELQTELAAEIGALSEWLSGFRPQTHAAGFLARKNDAEDWLADFRSRCDAIGIEEISIQTPDDGYDAYRGAKRNATDQYCDEDDWWISCSPDQSSDDDDDDDDLSPDRSSDESEDKENEKDDAIVGEGEKEEEDAKK